MPKDKKNTEELMRDWLRDAMKREPTDAEVKEAVFKIRQLLEILGDD